MHCRSASSTIYAQTCVLAQLCKHDIQFCKEIAHNSSNQIQSFGYYPVSIVNFQSLALQCSQLQAHPLLLQTCCNLHKYFSASLQTTQLFRVKLKFNSCIFLWFLSFTELLLSATGVQWLAMTGLFTLVLKLKQATSGCTCSLLKPIQRLLQFVVSFCEPYYYSKLIGLSVCLLSLLYTKMQDRYVIVPQSKL